MQFEIVEQTERSFIDKKLSKNASIKSPTKQVSSQEVPLKKSVVVKNSSLNIEKLPIKSNRSQTLPKEVQMRRENEERQKNKKETPSSNINLPMLNEDMLPELDETLPSIQEKTPVKEVATGIASTLFLKKEEESSNYDSNIIQEENKIQEGEEEGEEEGDEEGDEEKEEKVNNKNEPINGYLLAGVSILGILSQMIPM